MADLDPRSVTRAYARWAPVYDLVFGAVFDRGRRAAIDAAQRLGGSILEVGVGTGISLPDYARSVRLVGVDLSWPMLRKARARVEAEPLAHVEGLAVMDAQHLGFRDAAFEVVVAQYVITAVPNPETTLDEFARFVGRTQSRARLDSISARSLYRGTPPLRPDGFAARWPGWSRPCMFLIHSGRCSSADRRATIRAGSPMAE